MSRAWPWSRRGAAAEAPPVQPAPAPAAPDNDPHRLRRDAAGPPPPAAGRIVACHGLDFFVTGPITEGRAVHAMAKEPSTIRWIDRFEPGCRFWDIGANVGVYSLYAAKTRDCEVTAFEPVFLNYYVLNRSIAANALGGRIRAFALAIGETSGFADMLLADLEDGSALHSYGVPLDYRGEPFEPQFRQATACFSIDDLVLRHGFPPPRHLKIDVDGLEDGIVRGAARSLAMPELRTVMVELDVQRPEFVRGVSAVLEGAGLALVGMHHPDPASRVRNALFARRADREDWRAVVAPG